MLLLLPDEFDQIYFLNWILAPGAEGLLHDVQLTHQTT
jgi:hypothetical protein